MDLYFQNITYIVESIKINYKFWIAWAFSLYLINAPTITTLIVSAIFIFGWVYFVHYLSHLELFYPLNSIHTYHHLNNNWLSHSIEIFLEFITLTYSIPAKYIIKTIYEIDIPIIDNWIVFFGFLIYITVHNINYSFFHVNNTHELHHKYVDHNYGPDICDIMFQSKYKPEISLENTDHYIPNILICGIIVYLMKKLWNNSSVPNKNIYIYLIIFVYILFFAVNIYYTFKFFFDDLDVFCEKDLLQFCSREKNKII